jgi:WD repeat-containing protein 48
MSFSLSSHTDVVRDLLVTDDGKFIISASSDATIKLWSIEMRRCITNFSFFDDSVWCLYGKGNLENFWAGTRDGKVYKLAKSIDNECALLCQEKAPISSIVGIIGSYFWTSTTMTDINCWVF